ncbi:MAG: IS1595 family transposase [Candidatus Korobacteraceae bacterium]
MNSKPKMERYTKKDFDRQFPDDAACLEWLKNRLYPDGIYCENCEQITKHYRLKSSPSYSCEHCGDHVHPTANTIFHKSPTPLTTWFYAMYLMSATRCGISAKQIERETGVTYKTAWRMFKQIRSMLGPEKSGPIGGFNRRVEMDESYFGAKNVRGGKRGRPSAQNPTKVAVVGMVQRKGEVRAFVAADTTADTLRGLVKEHVLPKSLVFTDDYRSYQGFGARGYTHRRINHSEGVYVVGDTHTNTIEGFWSLVKNGIRGVYHNVGRHYLQTYLDEFSFRYNHRSDAQPMFTTFMHQIEKRDVVIRRSPVEVEPF